MKKVLRDLRWGRRKESYVCDNSRHKDDASREQNVRLIAVGSIMLLKKQVLLAFEKETTSQRQSSLECVTILEQERTTYASNAQLKRAQ